VRPKPHVDVRLLQPLKDRLAIFHDESDERRFRLRWRSQFEAESRYLFSQTFKQRLAMGLDAFNAQLPDVRQRDAERRHRRIRIAADLEVRARVASQLPGERRARGRIVW